MIGIIARKPRVTTEAMARRQNKVFTLLQQGKTPRHIMKRLRISNSILSTDLICLREGVKAEHHFIPPKGVCKWSPAKGEKIMNFIEFAKKVIRGEAVIEHKRKTPLWIQISRKKLIKINAILIGNPFQPNKNIAKVARVNPYRVKAQRQILVATGEIPDISVSDRLKLATRMPWRKTQVLSEQQRQRVLEQNNGEIQKRVRNLYYYNRKAFDFCNMLPETAVEKLCELLDWRLQTFDPTRTTLERFFSYSLNKCTLNLKRMVWRKFKYVASLDASGEGKKPLKEYLEALPEFEGVTVAQLQKISSNARLNILEQAVLFGRAAGLTDKKIGKAIGRSQTNVRYIKQRIEPWVENLISK